MLLYSLWSAVFPLTKLITEWSPPVFLTAVRMILAGIILLAYLLISNKVKYRFNRSQIISLILFSISSVYLTNILESWGIQHLSSSKSCFIYSLSPFFAMILSYFYFGEKITSIKFLGLIIGFLGMVPVFSLNSAEENEFWMMGFLSLPTLAVSAAAFFSVYGWILLRVLVKNQALSPLLSNGLGMLIGGSFALGHSLLVDRWKPTPVSLEHFGSFILIVSAIILISNIICYNIYGYLLNKFSTTFLTYFGLLSPFFTSIESFFILGEEVSWTIIFSTVIVAVGLWIVYHEELKLGYISK